MKEAVCGTDGEAEREKITNTSGKRVMACPSIVSPASRVTREWKAFWNEASASQGHLASKGHTKN